MKPITPQEVFDAALFTIRSRRYARAFKGPGGGTCVYRSKRGPCAIGASLPDSLYKPEMDEGEGLSVDRLLRMYPEIGYMYKDVDVRMLRRLQQAHDEYKGMDRFEPAMNSIAFDFNLSYKPPHHTSL